MADSLAGKRVLVTRPLGQADDLAGKIEAAGGVPSVVPVISVSAPDDWAPLDRALQGLVSYRWVIFTSANGVRAVAERMVALGVPMEILAERSLAAIGPATARSLADVCRAPDRMPDEFISDAVADVLGDVAGQRILLPRADIARRDLPIELNRRRACVDEVAAYSVRSDVSDESIRLLKQLGSDPPDYITLTSPSTVRGLAELLRAAGSEDWMRRSKLVCIGPITAKAVEELGSTPASVAAEYTTDGIVTALLSL